MSLTTRYIEVCRLVSWAVLLGTPYEYLVNIYFLEKLIKLHETVLGA